MNTADFHITPPSSYQLHNLRMPEGPVSLELSASLLDNGTYLNQAGWQEALQESPWRLITGLEYWGLMENLFDNQGDEHVKTVRKLLADDFKQHWMMTGTQIIYTPNGLDRVVHGIDQDNPLVVEADITGQEGYLNDYMRAATKALLGTDDIDKVKEVYGWLNNKKPYLWRFNKKPTQEVKRALVLGGSSGYADIDADDDVGRTARGVQKISTGNKGS
ncbi:hypothetical protein GOV07_02285 [Candidatus Woesearchaeota archaeon]|nr:hypothetical protein [Candidatus Woesearchaeota archaeon]